MSDGEDEISPHKTTIQSFDSEAGGVAGSPTANLREFNKLSKTVTDMRQNIRALKMKVAELESNPAQRQSPEPKRKQRDGSGSKIAMGTAQSDLKR